jgi:hypothetical protein
VSVVVSCVAAVVIGVMVVGGDVNEVVSGSCGDIVTAEVHTNVGEVSELDEETDCIGEDTEVIVDDEVDIEVDDVEVVEVDDVEDTPPPVGVHWLLSEQS